MIVQIVISIFMWIIYLSSAIAGIFVLISLFRIFIWDKVKDKFKKKFPYEDKEILEEDPFGEEKKPKSKKGWGRPYGY